MALPQVPYHTQESLIEDNCQATTTLPQIQVSVGLNAYFKDAYRALTGMALALYLD